MRLGFFSFLQRIEDNRFGPSTRSSSIRVPDPTCTVRNPVPRAFRIRAGPEPVEYRLFTPHARCGMPDRPAFSGRAQPTVPIPALEPLPAAGFGRPPESLLAERNGKSS